MPRFPRLNTAERAALVVALLGVLGVTAGLALATGVPVPRITSHPASWTRSRNANFRFTDSQPNVTFTCSLDGARFRSCGSSQGYGGLADGRHVFLVRAKTPSGGVSDPARYSWTVDYKAPQLAVSFAANNATYGSARWRAGCSPQGTGLCGTVTAPAGLKSVIVWIQQGGSGKYYNGRAYTSRQVVWNNAALSPKPAKGKRVVRATWSYRLDLPRPDGKYTVRVRATDQIGNINRGRTQKTLSFVVDTASPPTPTITSGPANPTAATSATLTFTDRGAGVTYQCNLDGLGWHPCTSPESYSGLSVGGHVFQVRAVNKAGNLSNPASYGWTVVPASGLPFTITGNATSALYPGGSAEPIALTLNNPNGVQIYVTSVSVTLKSSSLPAGCSASGYVINQASIPAAGVAVPANGSVSLPAHGATAPSIQMIDTGTNQDACQNAQLQLSYTGSAHS
jgi:large repetitive protein